MNLLELPTMLHVKFSPRKQKSGHYTLQISLRSFSDSTRFRGMGAISAPPEKWNRQIGRFVETGTKEDILYARKMNRKLGAVEANIQRVFDAKTLNDEPIFLNEILDLILLKEKSVADFSKLLDDFITDFSKSKQLRKSTVNSYRIRQKTICQYFDNQGNRNITSIKEKEIYEFQKFLSINKKVSPEYINYHVELLDKFFQHCRKLRKINTIPTLHIERLEVHKKKRTPYLENAQLTDLESLKLKKKIQQKVLKHFLFLCYSGMSYVDFCQISKSQIIEIEGKKFLQFKRQKSSQTSLVPYQNKLQKFNLNESKLEIWKFNYYLAQIGKKIGYDFKLTTKIARTTFAVYLLKEKRLRYELIAKVLGHASITTTQKYYADLGLDAVSRELSEVF